MGYYIDHSVHILHLILHGERIRQLTHWVLTHIITTELGRPINIWIVRLKIESQIRKRVVWKKTRAILLFSLRFWIFFKVPIFIVQNSELWRSVVIFGCFDPRINHFCLFSSSETIFVRSYLLLNLNIDLLIKMIQQKIFEIISTEKFRIENRVQVTVQSFL